MLYEGFNKPVAKLQRMVRIETRVESKNRSHGDANSINAQFLQPLNVVLCEPSFPMPIKDLVGSILPELLREGAADSFSARCRELDAIKTVQFRFDTIPAIGAYFPAHGDPF